MNLLLLFLYCVASVCDDRLSLRISPIADFAAAGYALPRGPYGNGVSVTLATQNLIFLYSLGGVVASSGQCDGSSDGGRPQRRRLHVTVATAAAQG